MENEETLKKHFRKVAFMALFQEVMNDVKKEASENKINLMQQIEKEYEAADKVVSKIIQMTHASKDPIIIKAIEPLRKAIYIMRYLMDITIDGLPLDF